MLPISTERHIVLRLNKTVRKFTASSLCKSGSGKAHSDSQVIEAQTPGAH